MLISPRFKGFFRLFDPTNPGMDVARTTQEQLSTNPGMDVARTTQEQLSAHPLNSVVCVLIFAGRTAAN